MTSEAIPAQVIEYAQDWLHITDEVNASVPACDFSDRSFCCKGVAKWVGVASHECGAKRAYLMCDDCKNVWTSSEDAGECRRCGGIVHPARHLWVSFEPINRRG